MDGDHCPGNLNHPLLHSFSGLTEGGVGQVVSAARTQLTMARIGSHIPVNIPLCLRREGLRTHILLFWGPWSCCHRGSAVTNKPPRARLVL